MIKPTLIAEIGCNHKGDLSIAKEFVKIAKDFCQVNLVKFQKRNPMEVLSEEEYHSPHPNPANSFGETYGAHREFLELNIDQHKELKSYCDEMGIVYGSSVWDLTSAKEMISLKPDYIKIPSATNTHFEKLEHLCKFFPGKIHISLGMTTIEEERKIVEFLDNQGRLKDTVLYACTSGYPVPPENTCLLEVSRLCKEHGNRVHAIGFSGHHNGIALDIAAFTLGATFIERHFTMDRTWKGTDHAASLEPDGLRKLNRDLNNTHKALSYKEEEILEIEIPQRKKLKWNRQHEKNLTKEKRGGDTLNMDQIKLLFMDVDGVLTDSGMYYSDQGDELKKFNTRDGQGMFLLQKAGIKTGIITRENTDIVERRAAKLKVDYLFQGATNKLEVLKQFLKKHKLTASDICYIGDDINDVEVLQYVGFAAVPRDAVYECRTIADYVCRSKGGEGCVREIASKLLAIQNNHG